MHCPPSCQRTLNDDNGSALDSFKIIARVKSRLDPLLLHMTELHQELLAIADRIEGFIVQFTSSEIKEPLDRLENAASTVGKSWSGSWLGYHAYVYYKDLQPPPPGAHFSQEWGIGEKFAVQGTTGDWREYNADQVEKLIYEIADNPNLDSPQQLADKTKRAFNDSKSEVISILTTALSDQGDSFLSRLKDESENISILSQSDIVEGLRPSGQLMSRDSLAATQGLYTPPHILVLSKTISIRQPQNACEELAQLARKAGSHLARKNRTLQKTSVIGTNVFIGHGQSSTWKDLKDFIQDRLGLPWDEFNRVPVAGITNIARLSEMLDASSIAFLIMTGEDEQSDGKLHARMNVVHEAGLFQGRLGFTKAIVLLEEGCEEFSNIQGLGQIRFPKGNIKAVFEEIRQVLERENVLETS